MLRPPAATISLAAASLLLPCPAWAGYGFRFLGTLESSPQPAEVRMNDVRPIDGSPDPTVGLYGSPVLGNTTLYFLDGVLLGQGDRPSLTVYDLPEGDRIEFIDNLSNPFALVTGSFRFPADTFNSDALPASIDFSRAISARVDIRGDNTLMAFTITSAVIAVPEPTFALAPAFVLALLGRRAARRP